MRRALRGFRIYVGISGLVTLGLVFLAALSPWHSFRLAGLGLLAAMFAWAWQEGRGESSQVFLRTRPDWRDFQRWGWLISIGGVLTAGLLGLLLATTGFDRRAGRAIYQLFADLRSLDTSQVECSWHVAMVPFSLLILVGSRMTFAGRWSIGVPLLIASALLLGTPARSSGRAHPVEVEFLWQHLGLRSYLVVAAVIALCGTFPLVRPFYRFVLEKLGPLGRLPHRLVGPDMDAGGRVVVLAGFALAILVTYLGFIRLKRLPVPFLALSIWSIYQLWSAGRHVGVPSFFSTRPSAGGGGALGGYRRIFFGAYARSVGMAFLVQSLFLMFEDAPGFPMTIQFARVFFVTGSVSFGFLAGVVTRWTLVREGEKWLPLGREGPWSLLAYFVVVAGTFAPSYLIYGFGAPGPCLALGILLAANALLAVVAIGILSRRLPSAASRSERIVAFVVILIVLVGILWTDSPHNCLRSVEIAWYVLRHGGYMLLAYGIVLGLGFLWTALEVRWSRRSLRAGIVALALSALVPSLGVVALYLTRSRESWHRHRPRVPLEAAPVLAWSLFVILVSVRGRDWFDDLASEAYMESPLREASLGWQSLWPRHASCGRIEVFPSPERLLFRGEEVPNPWRLSRRRALEKFREFYAEKDSFDHEAFVKEFSCEPKRTLLGGPFKLRFDLYSIGPKGRVWSTGGGMFPIDPPGPNAREELPVQPDGFVRQHLEDVFPRFENDDEALEEVERRFGQNTLHYLGFVLREPMYITSPVHPAPDFFPPEMVERCCRLTLRKIEKEGVRLPPVDDLRAYGHLAQREWPSRTREWYSLLGFFLIREVRRDPRPYVDALVGELETAYVVGSRPPQTIASWCLPKLYHENIDLRTGEDARRCERLVALTWAHYFPRERDPWQRDYLYILRHGSEEQQRAAVERVHSSWLEDHASLLAASGHEKLREVVRASFDTASGTDLDDLSDDTLRAVLAWPDADILDVVDGHWSRLLPLATERGHSRDSGIVPRLQGFVTELERRWPEDARVRRWKRDIEEIRRRVEKQ